MGVSVETHTAVEKDYDAAVRKLTDWINNHVLNEATIVGFTTATPRSAADAVNYYSLTVWYRVVESPTTFGQLKQE
jgi:predicted nucleic acid-binding protein